MHREGGREPIVNEALNESAAAADGLEEIAEPEKGSRPTTSLSARRSPLTDPRRQIEALNALELTELKGGGNFDRTLVSSGTGVLRAGELEIFQINLGKLCNMTCLHCHVDAGPDRQRENMDRETVDACLAALDQTNAHTVDLTGGAPELNPHFEYLVDQCVQRGKHVIDRCNLTVLLLPRHRELPRWLAERGVEIVCSLPHYRRQDTDSQRGQGTFAKSIEALSRLNRAGYGLGDPDHRLTLMVNPVGSDLTRQQCAMEIEWREGLESHHGITFDRLIALNNMPISRFLEWLQASGKLQCYMKVLVNSFNPETVAGLMCRNTLSVSWNGSIYDCDFNQMLGLGVQTGDSGRTIFDFDRKALADRKIVTGRHCFGCTAGAGSSCGGAIHDTSG